MEPRGVSANGVSPIFAHTRRQIFLMYYDRYLSECDRASADEADAREGTGCGLECICLTPLDGLGLELLPHRGTT